MRIFDLTSGLGNGMIAVEVVGDRPEDYLEERRREVELMRQRGVTGYAVDCFRQCDQLKIAKMRPEIRGGREWRRGCRGGERYGRSVGLLGEVDVNAPFGGIARSRNGKIASAVLAYQRKR